MFWLSRLEMEDGFELGLVARLRGEFFAHRILMSVKFRMLDC